MPKSINEGMLKMLDVEFTQEEVVSGIRQMHPTKVPGLDGMTTVFYQNFWDIVLQDVTTAILTTLRIDIIPSHLNHTFITLIPIKHAPKLIIDFRPISFCNVLYKIIEKILTNRLKSILPHVISPT